MSRTVFERIPAELVADGKTYRIQLRLSVKEISVDESMEPVVRAIAKREPVSLSGVPEGKYTLRYVFDGQQEQYPVRLEHGDLLGGH